MSDIAKRLRVSAKYNSFNGGFYERSIVKSQMEEAADYIEQLERDLIETRAALEVVVQQLRVELAAQCWCDPKTSHIEMNVDLADAVAYRIDRLLSQIADLRTEVAKNHAAWKVADEDCRNLTEKVIPNIRTELTEALAALLSARSLLAMAADWSTWFEEKYANTIKTAMGKKL